MSRTIRFAARFLLVVAVLVSMNLILGPSDRNAGPYVSALSTVLSGADAMAAKGCKNVSCDLTTQKCVHDPGFFCHVRGSICVGTVSC